MKIVKQISLVIALMVISLNNISAIDVCNYDLNDPKATLILDNISKEYLEHKSIEIDFTLRIEIAERKDRVETGKIIQYYEMFKVNMKDQIIYCDGTSLWYHMISGKEVQINDYEGGEDVGVMSPKDLLKQYKKGEFEYALVNETSENAKKIAKIEFKPNDEYSDYSKLRVSIDTRKNAIVKVKAFGKDGSIYTLTIDKEIFDKTYDIHIFSFDKDKHPEVIVEDLRLE